MAIKDECDFYRGIMFKYTIAGEPLLTTDINIANEESDDSESIEEIKGWFFRDDEESEWCGPFDTYDEAVEECESPEYDDSDSIGLEENE